MAHIGARLYAQRSGDCVSVPATSGVGRLFASMAKHCDYDTALHTNYAGGFVLPAHMVDSICNAIHLKHIATNGTKRALEEPEQAGRSVEEALVRASALSAEEISRMNMLPDEVLLHIFSTFDHASLLAATRVSRRWHDIIEGEHLLYNTSNTKFLLVRLLGAILDRDKRKLKDAMNGCALVIPILVPLVIDALFNFSLYVDPHDSEGSSPTGIPLFVMKFVVAHASFEVARAASETKLRALEAGNEMALRYSALGLDMPSLTEIKYLHSIGVTAYHGSRATVVQDGSYDQAIRTVCIQSLTWLYTDSAGPLLNIEDTCITLTSFSPIDGLSFPPKKTEFRNRILPSEIDAVLDLLSRKKFPILCLPAWTKPFDLFSYYVSLRPQRVCEFLDRCGLLYFSLERLFIDYRTGEEYATFWKNEFSWYLRINDREEQRFRFLFDHLKLYAEAHPGGRQLPENFDEMSYTDRVIACAGYTLGYSDLLSEPGGGNIVLRHQFGKDSDNALIALLVMERSKESRASMDISDIKFKISDEAKIAVFSSRLTTHEYQLVTKTDDVFGNATVVRNICYYNAPRPPYQQTFYDFSVLAHHWKEHHLTMLTTFCLFGSSGASDPLLQLRPETYSPPLTPEQHRRIVFALLVVLDTQHALDPSSIVRRTWDQLVRPTLFSIVSDYKKLYDALFRGLTPAETSALSALGARRFLSHKQEAALLRKADRFFASTRPGTDPFAGYISEPWIIRYDTAQAEAARKQFLAEGLAEYKEKKAAEAAHKKAFAETYAETYAQALANAAAAAAATPPPSTTTTSLSVAPPSVAGPDVQMMGARMKWGKKK